MTEYVHVGSHADVLASGSVVAPGERLTRKALDLAGGERAGEDQHLIEEGRLVDVESFGSGASTRVLSGDELKAKAAALNIEGRSQMGAEELRAAVVAAEEASRAA